MGFMVCRVIHFYSYSLGEVMSLPMRVFWLLSDSVERIRSEQDLCNLRVAGASQSSEGFEKMWKSLSQQVGETIVFDKRVIEMEKDVKGIAELKALSDRQRRR